MAVPTISRIEPSRSPTSGGEIIRIRGAGFAEQIAVRLGAAPAEVLSLRDEDGDSITDVRAPAHPEARVDVELTNLDTDGVAVPGEAVVVADAFRYLRPRLAPESDFTRLVRTLLRELKRQLLENVSISVHVDYDNTTADGLDIVALAELPSLTLTGPRLTENRIYSTNVLSEDVVAGSSGPEIVRRRPPYTVDLSFTITVASDRTAELLNLMAAVATFGNRNGWIEMPRNPHDVDAGVVGWEMDLEGEFRTRLDGPGDVGAFSVGLVIRGFDIDEGLSLDRGKAVETTQIETYALESGGEPPW